ncbi:hypothetical protein QTP86_022130, partial [Hemibagrus guttatus]
SVVIAMSPRKYNKGIEVEGMSNTLNQQYEDKVRPYIDLVDNLRLLGVEKDLNLPAIAVIGDQSSGKSSVLEALSGVSLPRGTGIVTRCPLVLKLKRIEKGAPWSAVLTYKDQVKILQGPKDVGSAVSSAQNVLAGEGKGISQQMISLEIQSSDVPDLTLIDLPGIARVATGDQPIDIEKQIKGLIEKFIKRQETISLVVVPANIDIATTEALKMTSKVDPNGQRTLGILTKPDLVDKGAEESVVNTVNNQVIPLKKGYMIVKCRGQQDINEDLSLSQALLNEQVFFQDHPHFRQAILIVQPLLEEGKATVPVLAERLTRELVEHINNLLPELHKQVECQLEKTMNELRKLGDGVPQEETEKNNFLIRKINNFNQVLSDVMRAEEDTQKSEPKIFTKMRKEFGKWKQQLDGKAIRLEENLQDEVEEYTSNCRGKELPGFVNYRTFENIVKKHVQELEEPAIQILKDISGIVHSCVNNVVSSHFEAFPNLMRAAKEPIEDLLEQEHEKALEKIQSQFKMEKIVYSQDGLYSRRLQAVKQRPQVVNFRTGSADVKEMAQHLNAYFLITSDRLANQVPLIVQYHVLDQYFSRLQTSMLSMIGGQNAMKLIREDSSVASLFLYEFNCLELLLLFLIIGKMLAVRKLICKPYAFLLKPPAALSAQTGSVAFIHTSVKCSSAKVAVVLSGCGVYDGTEIHEASAILVHLSRGGAEVQMYAPDVAQMHVIDHSKGQPSEESRNVLAESGRIARGNITDLAKLSASNYDAVIFPGGFGAAKNLSTFAVDGSDCTVNKHVERVLKDFHKAGKPIGLCCISPVLAAKVLPGVEVTVGHEQEEGGKWPYAGTAEAITALGAKHKVKDVTISFSVHAGSLTCDPHEAHVDPKNKVVTSPAFMCDTKLHLIFDGIGSMVRDVLKLTGK